MSLMNSIQINTWQQDLWKNHAEALNKSQLAHAMLFVGASGVGKKPYALALASLCLCDAEGKKNQACGECQSCVLIDAMLHREGVHPDLTVISPEKKGSFIKVAQIRGIEPLIRNSAQRSGYRVVIIHEANRLNVNAANALLKSLEEPGEKTLFLLVADSYAGLLPTIRSRCQVQNTHAPSEQETIDYCRERGLSLQQAQQSVRLFGCRPLLIMAVAQTDELDGLTKLVPNLATMIQQRTDSVSLAGQWQKLSSDWLALVLMRFLHRMCEYKAGKMPQLNHDGNVFGDAEQIILDTYTLKHLSCLYQSFERIHRLMQTSANPNKQLLWVDWLQEWGLFQAQLIEEKIQW